MYPRNVHREVRRTERFRAGRRLPYEKHIAPMRVNL